MSTRLQFTDMDVLKLLQEAPYQHLLSCFQRRRLGKGALVCWDEFEVGQILIVSRGRLRLFLSGADREFTVAFLEHGAIFSTNLTGQLEAAEDSEVLLAPLPEFFGGVYRLPVLTQLLEANLASLLNCTLATIETLAFKDVRARLVEFLVRSADERGSASEEGVSVQLGFATEEIARILGTTRQTTSTLINELVREGLVERTSATSFLLTDLEKLRAES